MVGRWVIGSAMHLTSCDDDVLSYTSASRYHSFLRFLKSNHKHKGYPTSKHTRKSWPSTQISSMVTAAVMLSVAVTPCTGSAITGGEATTVAGLEMAAPTAVTGAAAVAARIVEASTTTAPPVCMCEKWSRVYDLRQWIY